MFRHKGKNRTFIHNLRLATLLSFVAGIVNITGVLAVKTLTTNVTGHFAYFAEELMHQDYSAAITFFIFTLFFLLGAFTSNLISEFIAQRHPNTSHIIPIILEITLLAAVAFFGTSSSNLASCEGKSMAFAMLFAMGIQNSLVTKISQSTVRTTHLTGLFTDLGIELSQLFFYKKIEEKKKLKTNIYLRFSIISFFFIGCVLGGYLFKALKIKTLFVACFFLLIALLYDFIRLQYHLFQRKKLLSK
ncbi:MAG: hypothetical protein RL542_604 [Bacteroidota bacterium]|jgi:uncharacterized membrane protein YoaK (UPF0700 family)